MNQTDFDALGAAAGPASHALFVLERNLTIRSVNEVGKAFGLVAWGRSPRPGDSMVDFSVASALGDFRANVARAFAGESCAVRRRLAYPSGVEIVFDVFYDPMQDAAGDVDAVAFSASDVGDDVLRGDVVRLLAAGLAQTTDGVIIAEATGDLPVVYANEASLQITGYAREELLGRSCRFLRGSDTDQAAVRELSAAVLGGRACQAFVRDYRKNGELFYNQMSLSPIRSPGGQLTHFIVVQRDVTGRRNLEQRLASVERMEALGRLASGIAHDMNNYLMAVLATLDGLQTEPATLQRHGVELQHIEDTVTRARSLMSQLLLFARTRLSEPSAVDVAGHVRDLRGFLKALLPADVKLRVYAGTEPLVACVDPAHIEQVVVNLVVNARDAITGAGDIMLTLSSDASAPKLGGRECVKIEVRDTGAGMSEEVQARAFEPFFTTKSGESTGLGLATCFGIAKQYGGQIALESIEGAGTTCIVWLPKSEAGVLASPDGSEERVNPSSDVAVAVATGTALEGAPRVAKQILLVEDDDRIRVPLARSLRRFGYEVVEAADGGVALELLKTTRVDALVIDLVLPTHGGGEVAATCRALHPHAPQIFATGYGGADAAKRGIPADAVVLEKPFAPRDLAAKLGELIAAMPRRRV